MQRVATALEQVIAKHSLPGQTRTALTEVMELVKNAAGEEKDAENHVPFNAVETMHERFKADLHAVHDSLDGKISDLQHGQQKLLSSTESLSKTAEHLRSTTTSYRDALLAKPSSSLKLNADPKVLSDLDRRARQILIAYSISEENATLNVSLLDLKDKANKIATEMEDPTRPETVKIESVTRTRDGSLLLLLNSKEAADWLKEPDVEDKFLDKFAIGASIRVRKYNVLLKWVPITFDPNSIAHLREIEEVNNLPDHSIWRARWIKPPNRRRAGQLRAHAVLTLTTADVANRTIKDSLEICGVRIRAERTKLEPMQCLKCRGWEHKAQDCKATSETCGTCGENHRTNACKNRGNLYCASCKSNAHASWDRTCPEFRRRCSSYDEKFPENNMVYFPTEHDWTLTTRPPRIPLEERFPSHLAVKSIPITSRKSNRPVVRLPASRTPERNDSSQAQVGQRSEQHQREADDPVSRLMNRSQPNLVPLGHGREEGELPDMTEHDSILDHSDTAIVEDALDWRGDPPSMAGAWNGQPDW